MAISRVHTWSAGEVLSALDLNTEFNNILNNGADLVFPITKSISMNGFALYFDAAQTVAFTATSKGMNISATTALNETINTVASATTPDIWTNIGNVVNYTGTVIATGFVQAPQAGSRRTLICAGNAPFTAGETMLIDGYASGSTYTAATGEKVHIIAVTTTQFRLTPSYQDSSVDYLLSVAGTNTITATTQHTVPAYKIGQRFHGIAAATNTGATTLAISGLAAGAVQVGGAPCIGGELIISRPFSIIVTSSTPTFEITTATNATKADYGSGIVATTSMTFQQTAAPTGWTKITTHNDKALRVVSGTAGSGGSVAFTTAFASQNVGNTTLSSTQIPAHPHNITLIQVGTSLGSSGPGPTYYSGNTADSTVNYSTDNNTGGGNPHTHSLNIAVSYVDLILATKD